MEQTSIQTLKGTVKAVRKDGRGINVDDNWYSSYQAVECRKGDAIEITYVENGQWKNIKTLKVISAGISRERDFESSNKKIANILVSYAKDFIIARPNTELTIEEVTLIMCKAYKNALKLLEDDKEPEKEAGI